MISHAKIKLILIGSGDSTKKFINKNKNNEFFSIIGTIPDVEAERTDTSLELSDETLSQCDIAFCLGYSKIIPSSICDKHLDSVYLRLTNRKRYSNMSA